ncbi:MAG: hypothetical protein COB26_11945 [Piscirickettsiaceae bacterium]|nr:MAG: hypothetical protein COB26_11945 [Piscirickettsiaceae bacterium]
MKRLKFEWDKNKNRTNIKKHGVSFEEACATFYDEHAIQFVDSEHSEDEDRFLLLGSNLGLKTLVVCHCYRENETSVRIISARKADRDEQQYYWSERK